MIRLVGVVFGKELRDHARDRRSLASAMVFPLFAPLMVGLMLTLIASWESKSRPLVVHVVGRDRAPSLMAFLERHGAELADAPADYERKIRDDVLDVVVVVPEDYGKDFTAGKPASVQVLEDGSSNKGHASVDRTLRLLRAYSGQIGALRLLARGVSPQLAAALDVDAVDLATQQQRAASLLGMIPMFLLLGVFMGGMNVAIDAMAGERERNALEPLLTNPVPPLALVLGKWLCTVVAASVAVVVVLGGLAVCLHRVPLEDLGLQATFGPREALLLLAATAPMALLATAVQLLVATFARSFKEAQTYVSLVMLAPTVPGMIASLSPLKPEFWMNFVPGLGQEVLMTNVMRGDPVTAAGFVAAAVACAACAAVCLAVTARLIASERIVFGR